MSDEINNYHVYTIEKIGDLELIYIDGVFMGAEKLITIVEDADLFVPAVYIPKSSS